MLFGTEQEIFCVVEFNEEIIYTELQCLQELVLVLLIALLKPVIGENFESKITSVEIYSRIVTPNFGVNLVRRSIMSRKYGGLIFPLLIVLSMMLSACNSTSSTTPGHITIQLFFHSGQGPERDALNASLKAFSDRYPGITVDVVELPEGRYTDEVNVAVLAHSLPCLLDFDGPTLYNTATRFRSSRSLPTRSLFSSSTSSS